MPPAETQLQHRHHFPHCDAATAATDNMTLDAQFKIVRTTESSKNNKQHVIGCEYSWIEVDGREIIILPAAGVLKKLRDHFIATQNRKPPWSTIAVVRTFRKIEYHDVNGSGIFADLFSDKNPPEWTKQSSTTLEDTTEVNMVEVLAESDM